MGDRSSRSSARPRGGPLALGACAVAALALITLIEPARLPFHPKCAFHELTGWHCPGCGATRALHHLARGHVAAALRCNALGFVLLPLAGWLAISGRASRVRLSIVVVLAGVTVLFAVLRNIPVYPMTLLAPTG